MKKSRILLTAFLALTMVAVAACNTGGGKKKKKSGGGGGNVSDLVWEGGFSGAVTVGASTSVVEGREAQVMPSSEATSFATLANKRIFADESGDTYEFSFTFDFSVTVEGAAKPATDYIDGMPQEGNKTRLVFKGWPSQNAESKQYPRFTVKATGTCNGETKEKSYTLVLNPLDKVFMPKSLQEIYTAASDNQKLSWMGPKKDTKGDPIPDAYTTDLSQTEGQSSYWVETKGIITYCSQDGNWGLLQNGPYTIQLYRLDEFTLWNRDTMMNVPVSVKCEISEGYGNVQLSYVHAITPIEGDDPDVVTPTAAAVFNETMVSNKNWVTNPMFNKIVLNSDIKFVGNIRIANNGKAVEKVEESKRSSITLSASSKDRYEFDVKIGTTQFVVAYDYHAVKDHADLISSFQTILRSAAADSTIKVGGTFRWQNTDRLNTKGEISNDYSVRKAGNWVLVPYTAGQIG